MQKTWHIKAPNPQLQAEISNALGVHPILAQILINRDIRDARCAKEFLSADLSCLHDPFLLKDMDVAPLELAS